MYCKYKDDLYRILIRIKARFGFASWQYDKGVDAIHEHNRSGHNGQPCPDGNY
jgi:hypothetical protein